MQTAAMEPSASGAGESAPPKVGQTAILGWMGFVCWAAAVGVIRAGEVFALFDGSWATALVYIFTLLASHALLWACMRAADVDDDHAMFAAGVLCGVALMLHGLSLAWWPALYGADPEVVRIGTAWLLWGVGSTLFMGWLRNRKA